MIVAVDGQLTLGTGTGIGEYVRGLCAALPEIGAEVRMLQYPNLDPWRFHRRVLWDQLLLPRFAAHSGARLLHCASGTMPLRSPLPTVVTVHDIAWLRVQRHAPAYARYYFGPFMLKRYANAAAIAVDSSFSRAELLEVTRIDAGQVHVVYPGVASDFCQLPRIPSHCGEILVPGTVERRKNLEVLIRSLPLEPRARLISVGPFTAYHNDCATLARDLQVIDRVEFRGYVRRDQLLKLYASCVAVAVPSLYEGFGYAAAQALCAGVPVLVANSSSLPEIAGSDGRVADAKDPAAWAAAIGVILDDPASAESAAAAARSRSAQRFSWMRSARRMLNVYATALRS